MNQLNCYYRRSRISEKKFREIIKYFALDLTANRTAQLVGLTHKTVNQIYLKIRHRIAQDCQRQSPFSGEVEVDESYFGARSIKGKRGRGAGGKTIVFGIYKRSRKVFTEIVPNVQKETLQTIIRGRVSIKTIIHSDMWRGYNGLVDLSYPNHFRVNHSADEFTNEESNINGIESFWSFAKRRLQKFNGVKKETFNLHLKECEYRFNYRNENLYRTLLTFLKKFPL